MLAEVSKPEEQEFVSQAERLIFVIGRQVDGDIVAQARRTHLFGEESAFKCSVLKEPARGHELWSEDSVGSRIEFLGLRGHLTSQNREAFGIAVVQDLDDLSPLIAQTEVTFIDDQGAQLLRQMRKEGAEFTASGVDTQDLLENLNATGKRPLRRFLAHLENGCGSSRSRA